MSNKTRISRTRTRRDLVPHVLLILLLGTAVGFSLTWTWAQDTVPGDHAASPLFNIDGGLLVMAGLLLTIGGTAVGWGIAMGKVRAHCEDESKHKTVQDLDTRYYSRGEADSRLNAAIATMAQHISEKINELMRSK